MTANQTGDVVSKKPPVSSGLRRRTLTGVAVKWGPLMTLILLCVIITAFSPEFLTEKNFRAVSKQFAMMLIVAIGPAFVILMGCIDLSVEGLMATGVVFASLLVANDKTPYNWGFLGILAAVAVVTFMGFLNGVIHAKGRIPSFMVTLGMLSIGTGLGTWIFGGYPIRIQDPLLTSVIGRGMAWGSVPNLLVIALVGWAIALFIQKYTRLGRYVFAIGGGEDLAKLSGIPVDRYKIIVFTLGGAYLGVAGVLLAGRLGTGSPNVGSWLFPAVTAVVVGGTSLTGGVGGMAQTLIGALIVAVINNGMVLLNVHPFIQQTVLGIIITGAVILTLDRTKIPIIK